MSSSIHRLGQESIQQAHAPMYDTLQSDSKKALYLGCKEQNQMTTLSLGKMMTSCQCALYWRTLSYYKAYMI